MADAQTRDEEVEGTMTTATDRVSMPAGWLWLLRLGFPVLGFALGFLVRPLVQWAIATLDSAPAPLRIAAELPHSWLVPVLTLVGIGVGLWVAAQAAKTTPTVTIDDRGLTAEYDDIERYVPRERIGAVFTDPKELVLLDTSTRELLRVAATDLPSGRLAAALDRHNYPWCGERDPHEHEYRRWIDGHQDLDDHTNDLLRARREALAEGHRAQAEKLRTQLQEHGIVVRNRDRKQQYRTLT